MKKLSKELSRSYFFIIFCFAIMYTFPFYIAKNYLMESAKKEINLTKTFLVTEFAEEEHQDLDYFLKEVLKESPNVNNLYIRINYHEKIYEDEGFPKIPNLPLSNKIVLVDGSKFILNTTLPTLANGPVRVTFVNDISGENIFLKNIFKVSFVGLLIVVGISLYISKKFKNKLIPQLKELEEATNRVDLKSFNIELDKDNFFQEFANFITSYENMLKRIEKQSASQIDFVNNASHELKTPIFIIKGYMDLIQKWGLEDKEIFNESVEAIQDEIKSMSALVQKLLFLSKQESIKLLIEKFDLSELIEEIISEMNIIYPEQKIIFHKRQISIESDWSLLKQVIRNIIDNAIKYGNKKNIDIFLLERGNKIAIKIQDHGIGIPKKDLENIFGKFYRVDKSRSREIGGHGLGLAIVKNILELLNGTIEIKSELNKGTEVLILFDKF